MIAFYVGGSVGYKFYDKLSSEKKEIFVPFFLLSNCMYVVNFCRLLFVERGRCPSSFYSFAYLKQVETILHKCLDSNGCGIGW